MYLFQSENPFVNRIRYSISVKLVYSYTFSKTAGKPFSEVLLELAFTCMYFIK